MLNYLEFVRDRKNVLFAPAGYGKTHAIAECLKHTDGKQLILTHTHAGVASLKEKISKAGISNKKCQVETITSYAQKYVLAFSTTRPFPPQEDSKEYYSFIITEAKRLILIKSIAEIIILTYTGIFVDEYQDCTISQHQFIMALSNLLPIHLLGDPLQGIFSFNEELVDMEKREVMGEFLDKKYTLNEPMRWKINGNEKLGEYLKEIRSLIESGDNIDLEKYSDVIEVVLYEDVKKYEFKSDYQSKMWKLVKEGEDSLLIIHPNSMNKSSRVKMASAYKVFNLIEAIDDSEFYETAKKMDAVTLNDFETVAIDFCRDCFVKAGVDVWFNRSGLKNKKNPLDKKITENISNNILYIRKNGINKSLIIQLLKEIKKLPGVILIKRDMFYSLLSATEHAHLNNSSIYDEMVNQRNRIRLGGRKIIGKNIGTTLLTKGLEFQTVAVLDIQEFKCPKHLYVAITRAVNRLIIFSKSMTINTPQVVKN
jgi:DNA helicase-2/ATP-dependent DNA helicase PcrA